MAKRNYRPAHGSPLVGSATPINNFYDIEGNEMRNFPTIGCYELAPEAEKWQG